MTFALDLGILVVLLAFFGLGLKRSPIQELIATAGIVLGALLAFEWVGPWSSDVASFINMGQPTSQLIVSYALFLGTALVAGYGLVFILPNPKSIKFYWRPAAGVISAFNGSLILGYLLTFAQMYYYNRTADSPILSSYAAWILINWVGLVFVALVILMVPVIAVLLVVRWAKRPKKAKPAVQAKPAQAASSQPRPATPPSGGASQASGADPGNVNGADLGATKSTPAGSEGLKEGSS